MRNRCTSTAVLVTCPIKIADEKAAVEQAFFLRVMVRLNKIVHIGFHIKTVGAQFLEVIANRNVINRRE